METRDVLEELTGHHAYDMGSVDSGVHDVTRKQELLRSWRALPVDEARIELARFARDAYLSDDALEQRYGLEDAVEFFRWLEEEA